MPQLGNKLEYRHLIRGPDDGKWTDSFARELGRLAKGDGNDIVGTNTIYFIPRKHIPQHKKVTYGRLVCEEKQKKTDKFLTRLTVGGDQLDYEGQVETPSSDLFTLKTHLNSVISTPQAKLVVCDIHFFT